MAVNKQSVALGEFDRKIVSEFAEPRGLSFSAAIRMIIREWHDFKLRPDRSVGILSSAVFIGEDGHTEDLLNPAQQVVEELRQELPEDTL